MTQHEPVLAYPANQPTIAFFSFLGRNMRRGVPRPYCMYSSTVQYSTGTSNSGQYGGT